MTVWFPSLPFARNLVAAPEPEAEARPHPARPADNAIAADAAETDPAEPGARPWAGNLLGRVALSLVVGTLAATGVLFAGRAYLAPPPQEAARLQQLAHTGADLTEAQQAMAQKLRTLETEAVATGETVAALGDKLRAQAAATATLQAAVAKLAADGPGSRASLAVAALVGVAAVQLHDAVAAGRPFDWELVNLRGIVSGPPALLAALDRLAPLAATGVPTQAQLADGLRMLAQIDAQRTTLPLVGTGIELVGRVFGQTLAPLRPTTPDLLARAVVLLGDGDVAGAARLLRNLDEPTATTARPLVLAAEQRAAALAAVQTLLTAARTGLRGQLKLAGAQP